MKDVGPVTWFPSICSNAMAESGSWKKVERCRTNATGWPWTVPVATSGPWMVLLTRAVTRLGGPWPAAVGFANQ